MFILIYIEFVLIISASFYSKLLFYNNFISLFCSIYRKFKVFYILNLKRIYVRVFSIKKKLIKLHKIWKKYKNIVNYLFKIFFYNIIK